MIKILYDPSCPGLEFSVAAVLAKLQANKTESGLSKLSDIFSMGTPKFLVEPCVLLKYEIDTALPALKAELSLKEKNEDEIVLIGIHPKNNAESRKVLDFFDKYKDNILLWVDGHKWPKDMAEYLMVFGNNNVFIDENSSCLNILKDQGFSIPNAWLVAEENMKNSKASDPLSKRFLHSLKALKNLSDDEGFKFSVFQSIVYEILFNKKSENVDTLLTGLKNL